MKKQKEEWQDPDSGYSKYGQTILNLRKRSDEQRELQIKQIQTCLMCHFCANKQKTSKISSYFNQ